MNNSVSEKHGSIKISDDVIIACAEQAVLKTPGIAALSGKFADLIPKNLPGKESLYKGVRLSREEEGIILDLFVSVKYGINIPAACWDLQENVKKEVTTLTGEKVLAINVNIQGVQLPTDAEEENTRD